MRPVVRGLTVAVIIVLASYVLAQDNPAPPVPPPSTGPVPPAAPPAVPDDPVARPFYSRQPVLQIPVTVHHPDKHLKEVLLFVSTDYGANWQAYARQAATQNFLTFRAERDGDYCFTSRTVMTGTDLPPGVRLLPQLRIIVDTAEPQLDAQATVTPTGEVQLSWAASDSTLAPESVRVEYQSALGQPWRSVAVSSANQTHDGNAVKGQLAWTPEGSLGLITVRLEVSDRAGNAARTTRLLRLPLALFPTGASPSNAGTATSPPPDPLGNVGMPSQPTESVATGSDRQAGQPNPPAATPPPGIAWPSDAKPNESPLPRTDFVSSSQNKPVPSKPSDSPVPPPSAAGAPASGATGGVANGSNVASGHADSSPSAVPAGERPRMTSSTRFNLDYSVDAVGAAGVEKVELWITRNRGRDWEFYGTDKDLVSPLLVQDMSEGIYGFRVVIVGKNGLASQTPRSGDLADLWVGVDTKKPTVEIASAAYGTDAYAGQLDIRWTATDDYFGSRPITLAFSEKPEGPWTTIAAGLPNSGQYHWRVDASVPAKFFVRVEARDEAGNTGYDQTDEPLRSAGLTPKGHIRGLDTAMP